MFLLFKGEEGPFCSLPCFNFATVCKEMKDQEKQSLDIYPWTMT